MPQKRSVKLILFIFLAACPVAGGAVAYAASAVGSTENQVVPAKEAGLDATGEKKPEKAVQVAPVSGESVEAPVVLTPLAAAHPPDDQQVKPGPEGIYERTSLDLRNIEVTEALRFLAQKGGLNLAISKNVQGRVQLLLNDVPIKDILDILLITNQLAYEKTGEIYYIMTEVEYKERFGRKFSDARKVKVFHLNYAIPDQAFALLDVLKSEIGRILVDPESGTVLVMDTQENINRMQSALEGLEQRRSVKVYNLQYAKAQDVEARLKTQLDAKKVGLVTADERTNQVVVETLPERMKDIDGLVKALDQKTREVLIDAKIIKVTMSDDLKAEIHWEGIYNQLTKVGTAFVSSHPFSPLFRTATSTVDNFASISPTSTPKQASKSELTDNLYLGTVGKDSYEVLINFLKTLGETKILSNPKLAVVNNQEAKIHVGEKQAYVTTTTTTGQTTTTTAEAVTFVDVGIQLAVTPTINQDGFVTMKIKPEVSSVVSFLTTPSGNKIPIIDSSVAETSVMVKDGVSIIIGGLRKDEKVEDRRKVPFLGDIPILGIPFNSFTNGTHHTELLILITPHIVYGDRLVTGTSRLPEERAFMSYTDYQTVDKFNKKGEMKNVPVHS